MTTLEMLDAVEAGIAALRSCGASAGQPAPATAEAAAALRSGLEAAGVSAGEFARAASVPRADVDAWTAGVLPVPAWVPAALRLMALLTPSARHKLLYGRAISVTRPANSHPFSRIEDL